jgi:ATP-binding cassette subfamily C protein
MLALVVSPRLTLVVLVVGALLAVPMMAFQRWAYTLGSAAVKAMQVLFDVLAARMNGLKLAKAFAIERDLEIDFAASSAALRRAVIAAQENSARASLLQEVTAAILLVVLVYIALTLFKVASIDLILLIMIFARLVPLAQGIQTSIRSLAGVLPEYVALHERMASARAAAEPLSTEMAPIAMRQSVALCGVSFSYPDSASAPVLHDVSMVLSAHSATGILGLSGAGKSTLADIIAGLIPPDHGQVVIDGVPLNAGSRMQWRASVAYVTQDAPLYNDTLRENLRVRARHATDAEIWSCLEVVRAAELTRRLPDGLNTLAGDRGVRFSAGERQRFRLASALLRRPQLLILDESTSALNPADEEPILAGLRHFCSEMSILMIAHRTSSVRWTDHLLIVQNGHIVADGATSDVLEGTFPHHPSC